MTVENVSPVKRYPYTGPGNYTFSFLVYDEGDIVVVYTATDGTQTELTIETDYTVTLNSGSAGGTIGMILDESDGVIQISRELDYTQETAWENEGALDMQLLEQDFDKTVMLLQQLRAEVAGEVVYSNWKRSWQTSTAYAVRDVVEKDNSWYQCLVDHTSGTFSTDSSNGYWQIVVDYNAVLESLETAAEAAVDELIADVDLYFGPLAVQVFTSSGTYTKTSGATVAIVEVVGGGGSGGGSGSGLNSSGGGGAGGYSRKRIDLSSVTTETVTIGAGGASVTGANAGNAGGTSSFGSHCSATGGAGGTRFTTGGSASGGAGSGGDINANGGCGLPPMNGGGHGGASFFGGGNKRGETAGAYGAGGEGATEAEVNSATGKGGIVIVTEY